MDLENKIAVAGPLTGASAGPRNILDQLRIDFEKQSFPWIGDFKDFALGYLTFASTLHARVKSIASPVGSFVMGSTSSGKTQFLEALRKLFPEEIIINLTTASARSFIYQCKNDPYYLNGMVIFVEEMAGLQDEDIQYLLRTLVTKGEARHTTVSGGEVQIIDVIAGISLQSTGLKQDLLREDTMNRMVLFKSDDSNDMTKKVIANIKRRYIGHGDEGSDYTTYKSFFRKLKPYKVSIPYADRIQFKITNTENRRLAKIFMDLLATVALVHQAEREIIYDKGVLISDIKDFHILHDLISKDPSVGLDSKLNRCERAVFKVIDDMQHKDSILIDDIKAAKPGFVEGKFAGYGGTSIRTTLGSLKDMGLIEASTIGKKMHVKLARGNIPNDWGVVGLAD